VDSNRTSAEAAKHVSSVLRPPTLVADGEPEIHSCDNTANEPVVHTPGRFLWDNECTKVLLSTFSDEIRSKSVSVSLVKSKIKDNNTLASIGYRRVYDRLRWEMSQPKNTDEVSENDTPETLPKETLHDKVARMTNGTKEPFAYDNDSNSDDDIVPPTSVESRQRLFSDSELEIIQVQCRQITASGPITSDRITRALEQSTVVPNYYVIILCTR